MNFLFLITISSLITFTTSVSFEQDVRLTLSEVQALEKFRQRVKPILSEEYMKSDLYLIRWLRARNFDDNSAEAFLKENIRWRAETRIENAKNENFTDMFFDYPATVNTYDLTGRPICQIDFSQWDLRGAVLAGQGRRVIRYLDMLTDNMLSQVFERQKKGYNVTQYLVLANTDNFNLVSHACPLCIPVWVQYVTSLERHFDGWIDELIIVNAPPAVNTLFQILRPSLSRHTRECLRIFGQNKNTWMKYLDTKVSRSERSQIFGGSKPPAPGSPF